MLPIQAHSNLGGQGGPDGVSLMYPGEALASTSSDALVFAQVGQQRIQTLSGVPAFAYFNLEVRNLTEYTNVNSGATNGLIGKLGRAPQTRLEP